MKLFLTTLCCLFLASTAFSQEYGIASYYSNDFTGSQTAYGEKYDPNKMTCAHKTHPTGTLLKVTRLDNKKSVTVRVNDKGPYIKGRIVDVSYVAAQRLGLIKDGLADVKVEIVGKGQAATVATTTKTPVRPDVPVEYDIPTTPVDVPVATTTKPTATKPATTTTRSATATKSEPKPTESPKQVAPKSVAGSTTAKGTPKASMPTRLVTKDYDKYGVYRIVLERPTEPGYGVQVAALANYDSVMKQVAELQAKWFEDILVNIEPGPGGVPSYKIILGMFDNEASATSYKRNLAKKHKINGFVVPISVKE